MASKMSVQSFDKQTSMRDNCLNLIRLLAALDVFYGHAIRESNFGTILEANGLYFGDRSYP